MKILHTSDWHIGKVLGGQSRAEEQIAVLAEIVEVARAERPDLVIVAGDLYDTAAPTPEATRIVTRALSALRRTGADVVAIAGNHDNGASWEALRGWAEAAGITVRGTVRQATDHLITGVAGSGEAWRCVALPFLSQRYAVRATEMFDLTGAEANQTYADHLHRLLTALTSDFDNTAVNLITAHLTVVGATMGGGEREAHTIQAYAVPGTVFSAATHYVALGHLHRQQAVNAPCPVHYSGSPIAIDFGEEENSPGVLLVEVTADTPAKVRDVPLSAATPLRTVRGTVDELATLVESDKGASEAWLRVYVRERPRAGLREQVQELLPRALQVRIDPEVLPDAGETPRARREGRTPRQLFTDYLSERGHDDPGVRRLFDQLYAEVQR
ncbi:MAG: exonuclease SbcCD subunit D [Micromonosporaceae bacterium]